MNGELLVGRVPPQNIEAEQAVLGAILLDAEALAVSQERIRAEDFYRTNHQRIFEAMEELSEENEPIDLVTLTAKLQDKHLLEEIGGVSYLSELANAVPTAANVDYYAAIVEEKSMLRRLIRDSDGDCSSGYAEADDVSELLSEAEKRILDISNRKHTGFIPIKRCADGSVRAGRISPFQ